MVLGCAACQVGGCKPMCRADFLALFAQVGGEVTLAVVAITVLPIIYEARRSLTGEKADDKNGFRPIPFL